MGIWLHKPIKIDTIKKAINAFSLAQVIKRIKAIIPASSMINGIVCLNVS
jgi:hypothetical protein